jgi:oligosaccharide repeat unit polymerase
MLVISCYAKGGGVFTRAYLVVMFIFVGLTFAIYKIDFKFELIAASSVVVISAVSILKTKIKSNDRNNSVAVKFGSSLSDRFFFLVALAGGVGFLMPLTSDHGVPLLYMIMDAVDLANESREYHTKTSWYSVILMVILYFSFVANSAYWGCRWRYVNSFKRFFIILLMVVLSIISVAYAQKANPFFMIGAFFVGWMHINRLNIRVVFFIALAFAVILFTVGLAFVGIDSSLEFFLDMLLRRLGEVPAKVYAAYMEYGLQNPIQLLNGNFTFITGNTPLPVTIYHFMEYGDSDLGWANGLYVGDLYVNFGVEGVFIFSVVLGYFLGYLNVKYEQVKNAWGVIIYSLGMAFVFFLGTNALFSGVMFFVVLLILSSVALSKYKLKLL